MKFGVVNKLTIVNEFVPQTLRRNISRSVIITRKTTEKMENLKCGEGGMEWKRAHLKTD